MFSGSWLVRPDDAKRITNGRRCIRVPTFDRPSPSRHFRGCPIKLKSCPVPHRFVFWDGGTASAAATDGRRPAPPAASGHPGNPDTCGRSPSSTRRAAAGRRPPASTWPPASPASVRRPCSSTWTRRGTAGPGWPCRRTRIERTIYDALLEAAGRHGRRRRAASQGGGSRLADRVGLRPGPEQHPAERLRAGVCRTARTGRPAVAGVGPGPGQLPVVHHRLPAERGADHVQRPSRPPTRWSCRSRRGTSACTGWRR